MRGSFSIEASLIVPLVLAVMVLALRTGIDCYEETKAQVAKLGTRVSFDIVDVSIWNLIPRWQCLQTETVDGLVPW